jgi:hypothetical protein
MLRHYGTVLPSSTDLGAMAGRQANRLCLIRAQVGPRGGIAPGHGQVETSHGKETAARDSAMARLGTEGVPGVPGPLLVWEDAASARGHRSGTGVPGVPALSNSLSPCPNAKSGCNTLGWVSPPRVLQPVFGLGDGPLAGPARRRGTAVLPDGDRARDRYRGIRRCRLRGRDAAALCRCRHSRARPGFSARTPVRRCGWPCG